MPHSFGDKACHDAFIVRLQQSAQLTPEIKADGKISEDDPSCGAANFLAAIASPCLAGEHQSQFQKPGTSPVTTASSQGTSS